MRSVLVFCHRTSVGRAVAESLRLVLRRNVFHFGLQVLEPPAKRLTRVLAERRREDEDDPYVVLFAKADLRFVMRSVWYLRDQLVWQSGLIAVVRSRTLKQELDHLDLFGDEAGSYLSFSSLAGHLAIHEPATLSSLVAALLEVQECYSDVWADYREAAPLARRLRELFSYGVRAPDESATGIAREILDVLTRIERREIFPHLSHTTHARICDLLAENSSTSISWDPDNLSRLQRRASLLLGSVPGVQRIQRS